MKHEKTLAYGAFAIVCLVWGTTYLFIRIALETIPPLLLTGSRFTAAGLIMLLVAKLRGEVAPCDFRTLAHLAFVGFLLVGVGNLAVVWAEQWVPSGLAALLVATAPFWMAIIEALRPNGERVELRGGIGMLIGFLGVAMLVAPSGGMTGKWSAAFLVGALAIQIGGACWQYGSAHAKYQLKHVPLLSSAALQMMFGGMIVTVVGLAIGEASRFTLTPRTFGALAYLTIFGSIAHSAYVFALAHMRTTHASLYAYVNPVIAVFLGWLILDERLTWVSGLAMVIILVSVAFVQTPAMKRKPMAVPVEVVERAARTRRFWRDAQNL